MDSPEASSAPAAGPPGPRSGRPPLAPWRRTALLVLGSVLCAFTLAEVNYPHLSPQTQLAAFAMLGLILCFLHHPPAPKLAGTPLARGIDLALILATLLAGGYFIVQNEPAFQALWSDGRSLGNRAGRETGLDFAVGGLLLILVIEGTRRSIGLALPILSFIFVAYALFGNWLPDWLLSHRGYSLDRVVTQTALQGQGVFGVALKVMFTYVFLFVVFGAFLKATGATQFIIEFAQRVFRRSPGGPAKVSILSSGLMGSLSGSAVANTATTGTFTIPMMRASGYKPTMAAGIEAAASSGGALVPPVMGAAAYLMLEIVTPAVSYLEIIKAAILPAVLYYLSLFLIVHFHSRKLALAPAGLGSVGSEGSVGPDRSDHSDRADGAARASEGGAVEIPARLNLAAGLVFAAAFASLLGFLFVGFSPQRAVTFSLGVIVLASCFHRSTRFTPASLATALRDSARDVVPLICAAACVGVIIGVVTLTGVGTAFPALILPIAEGSLFLALLLIMVSSIVLGMGLPSVVCYLLLATFIGSTLGELGVVPLAGHMFIFYFAMLSMVTPPVALAAYAAASIAGSPVMATAFAAFRASLVGFFLPFLFVFRPELLMLAPDGGGAPVADIVLTFAIATVGVVAFASGLAGYLFAPVSKRLRLLFFLAAGLLLFPGNTTLWDGLALPLHDLGGALLFAGLVVVNWRSRRKTSTVPPADA